MVTMSYSEAWRPSLRLPRQNGKTNPLVRRVIELEDENTKLRELVRDMWSAYHDGATNKEFRALPDRMRELGVEL